MIGGLEPLNSGSHLEMSSSSPITPRSTKVMNVAAVSHFDDDATDSGVVPVTSPTVCSWITEPSAATIRITPPDRPTERTRVSSNASVASKVSGAKTLRAVVVVTGVVVIVGATVDVGTDVDVDTGAVVSPSVLDGDEPQPTTNSPHPANATTCLNHTRAEK